MTELQVIARYTIAAGREDEVLALLPKLAAAARSEPGNVSFVVYRQLDDEREVVLLERYASRDAFAAHRETAHFKDLVLGQIVPRLDSRVVEAFDVVEPAAA
jgi:quinol monooxygenase YgiN